MPIPVEELLKAREPLRDRILKFLRADPKQAYNLAEIVVGIRGGRADEQVFYLGMLTPDQLQKEMDPYLQAIKDLKTSGDVLSGDVQGSTYYWPKVPF